MVRLNKLVAADGHPTKSVDLTTSGHENPVIMVTNVIVQVGIVLANHHPLLPTTL